MLEHGVGHVINFSPQSLVFSKRDNNGGVKLELGDSGNSVDSLSTAMLFILSLNHHFQWFGGHLINEDMLKMV